MIEYCVVEEVPKHIKLSDSERFVHIKNSKYHTENGIAGILSLPEDQGTTVPQPVVKFVLLLHGMQSHKNAIYQPRLAAKLAGLGYMVLRVDFRDNGDSEGITDENGRTIQRDVEDIETIYTLITKHSKLVVNRAVVFDTIVAHSRGVLSMFEFVACHHVLIPNLINCSARYDGKTLQTRLSELHPKWQEEWGYYATILRHDQFVKKWIPINEMMSFITLDTGHYNKINASTRILSCYGTKEDVIPVDVPEKFAHLFQSHRHTLRMIEGANHNYYGHSGDPNIRSLPLRKGRVDYNDDLIAVVEQFIKCG